MSPEWIPVVVAVVGGLLTLFGAGVSVWGRIVRTGDKLVDQEAQIRNELRAENKELKTENDALRAQITALQVQNAELRRQNDALSVVNHQLIEERTKAEADRQVMAKKIEDLEAEVSRLARIVSKSVGN